jgi:Uma2 family endonuclease
MASPAHRASPLTIDDYLLLEEASATRHEYVAGQVHALAGTTKRHNTIAGNIHALLWQAMGDGPCRVFIGDVKLRAGSDAIYYPDVMVVCEPDGEAGPLIVEAPCLVVEVISPSTASIDRREKLAAYRGLPSLRAYLVVEQELQRVERHWRDEEGTWQYADHTALAGAVRVPLACPDVVLTLADIYRNSGVSETATG